MILFFLFWLALPKLSIAITPHVAMVNGAIRVTCRVPPDARNRGLSMGLDPVTSSFHQLNGEESRVTWELVVEHIPCEADNAFCSLVQANPAQRVDVNLPIAVAGCDGGQHETRY